MNNNNNNNNDGKMLNGWKERQAIIWNAGGNYKIRYTIVCVCVCVQHNRKFVLSLQKQQQQQPSARFKKTLTHTHEPKNIFNTSSSSLLLFISSIISYTDKKSQILLSLLKEKLL